MARLGVDNLTQLFMQDLMNQGILSKKRIGKKLMTFGANEVFVFQTIRLGVTKQNLKR
jgi:hypothetical protein